MRKRTEKRKNKRERSKNRTRKTTIREYNSGTKREEKVDE